MERRQQPSRDELLDVLICGQAVEVVSIELNVRNMELEAYLVEVDSDSSLPILVEVCDSLSADWNYRHLSRLDLRLCGICWLCLIACAEL